MNIIITKNYQELSIKAAEIVASQIEKNKNIILGLPTGQTPIGMYKELIQKYQKGEIDFFHVVTFNLDEYYGLPAEHPQSYNYFMWNIFFNYINIKKENVHLLNGETDSIEQECQQYESMIDKKNGIDLQILGIGDNGHIGFNEPGKALISSTHLVNLSCNTIKANSRFFNSISEVPRQALTMGIGTIMKAKRIILLASGKNKAPAIAKTVNGLISTDTPSSFLQIHNDVTIIADKEAASEI